MTTNVVVEGRYDAAIMRTLIDAAQLRDVKVVSGQGKSSAMSLAKSIAVSRSEHVAVVVDADTRDARQIDEQRRTFSDLQASANHYTRLFLAVPTLEEDLFPDVATFMKVFRVAITERQRSKFAKNRMDTIRTYFVVEDNDGELRVRSHGVIDMDAARDGFGRHLLRELFGYLRDVSAR